MIALCVDDEPIMLAALQEAVEASPDIEEIYAFEEESDAMIWAQSHQFDIAFLDIELHGVSGTKLAEILREKSPYLPIIFCTGYPEYALEAIKLHADGYLLKPIASEDVQKEIDRVLGKVDKRPLIFASNDGLVLKDKNGENIVFSRSKTIDLFRLILDANGTFRTTDELCASIFGNNPDSVEKDRNYFFHLFNDMRKTFSRHGAEDVLIKNGKSYGLNMRLVSFTDNETGIEKR